MENEASGDEPEGSPDRKRDRDERGMGSGEEDDQGDTEHGEAEQVGPHVIPKTPERPVGGKKKAAAGASGKTSENAALANLDRIIEDASEDLLRAGRKIAEERSKLLVTQDLNENPGATRLLTFVHMLMANGDFAKRGRAYIKHINELCAEKGIQSTERAQLVRDINVALGRSADDSLDAQPGDVFIKEAYENKLGWSWQDGSEYWVPAGDSFCGFNTDFILNTIPRSRFTGTTTEGKGGSAANAALRQQKEDFLAGTAIIVVYEILREVLRDNKELLNFFTAKPPSKTVALCLVGMFLPRAMKSSTAKKHSKLLGKPRVEDLPTYGVLKERVEAMMDARKKRSNLTRGNLTAKDALAWLKKSKKPPSSGSPKKKKRRTGSGDDDDEDDDEDDDDVAKPVPREQPRLKTPDLKRDDEKIAYTYPDLSAEKYSKEGNDDGAYRYFKRWFEKCYVDGAAIPADIAEDAKPKVDRFKLDGVTMCDDKTPELIILRNAMSDAFVKALIVMYQTYDLPFVDENSKAFRPFVLDAATLGEHSASFQMGKDAAARYMRAFDAHLYEKILTILLESHVRAALKHKLGENFELVFNCGGVNVTILYYRRGFQFHFDHDSFNNLLRKATSEALGGGEKSAEEGKEKEQSSEEETSSDPRTEKGTDKIEEEEFITSHADDKHKAPLPTPETMVIVTIVLSGPMGSVKPTERNYNLTWRCTKTGDKAIKTSTGHNDIHIQIGLDKDYEHGGETIRWSFKDNCWRLTITLRGYCNPTVNLKAWLARASMMNLKTTTRLIGNDDSELTSNVLTVYENPHLTARSIEIAEDGISFDQSAKKSKAKSADEEDDDEDDDDEDDAKEAEKLDVQWLLSDESNRDVYENCPWAEIPLDRKWKLSNVPAILQQRQPIAELYFSWPMQQVLLRNRIVVRLVSEQIMRGKPPKGSDGSGKGLPVTAMTVPMWESGSGQLVLPESRKYYSVGAMQLLANVTHTNRSKPIACSEHLSACTSVVLTCPNRVDHKSLGRVLSNEADDFFFYGSGGSAIASGQVGADPKKSYTSETSAWATAASPQDTQTNKINQVLVRCAENSQMLSIWIGPEIVKKVIGKRVTPMRSNEYMHVGRFYCCGEEIVEGQTSAETSMDKQAFGLNDYVGFRLRAHHIFKVRRINDDYFAGLHSTEDALSDESRDWRLLGITDRPDEYADLRLLEKGDSVARHLGVGENTPKGLVHTQLEYHYEQHIAPIRAQLLPVHSAPIIANTDANDREDCKVWLSERNRLREQNPYSKPLQKGKSRRSKKISISEWLRLMQAIQVAGFMRMLGYLLNKKKQSVPLKDRRLGSINRKFSSPMAVRDYDVAPLLYAKLSKTGFDRNRKISMEDPLDLQENLLAALICHLYGRPGFIGNYVKSLPKEEQMDCLRIRNIQRLREHMTMVVKQGRVSLSRCVVQQYEKQIPSVLRTNVDAATRFLESFVAKLPDIIDKVICVECTYRREYVIPFAEVMASLLPGVAANEFYFLAQHIIATFALSYIDGELGQITLDDVHMGPGSKQAVTNIGWKKNRPKKDRRKDDSFDSLSRYIHEGEGDLVITRLLELSAQTHVTFGLFAKDGKLYVSWTGREFTYLDLEHFLCKLYLYLNKKAPARLQSIEAFYHLCQCHPARFNTEVLDLLSMQQINGTLKDIATQAVKYFEDMKDDDMRNFQLSWRLLFRDELDNPPADYDEPPIVDPALGQNRKFEDENEDESAEALDGSDEFGYGSFFAGENAYHSDPA